MSRNRMIILALLSLSLSVTVTWLAYRVLGNRLAAPDDMGRIVVASQKLTLGSKLSAADVRLVSWPKAVALDGSFADIEQVVGRGVVTTMSTNEPILESKLASRDGGSGLVSVIPEGMRAMSVKVNDVVGVAGFVLPGTRVDVILSGSPDSDREANTAKIFLENIQVLAAGQNVEQDANGKPQNVQVITLVVTPDDAQKLALASVDGRIQLALRNPLDEAPKDPAPILRKALYEVRNASPAPPVVKPAATKAGPRVAVRLPAPTPVKAEAPKPALFTVDVFMGQKKETVKFEVEPVVVP